jgi:cell fate regulator YaaT (PSP1 superfamily)
MIMENENWSLPEISEKSSTGKSPKSIKFEKLSTFDYLSLQEVWDIREFDIYEISFNGGSRKDFCRNAKKLQLTTGDWVVVDTGSGIDVGKIALSGDLVRLQMKKKKTPASREFNQIIRLANQWEIDRLEENKSLEYSAMVRAKAISASLGLDMKIGEVEYQADRRKATFYYTSDARIDFRELVKEFAREFKVKIEMRQIGIRQESAKIGGIASCGRELCCSTWFTNFTSVTTEMVKYQNLSVNQSKLTGLCGRLKCCLNYELDVYLEALEDFPKDADVLELEFTKAYFLKLDIFNGLMYYTLKSEKEREKIYALSKERVVEIKQLNKKGIKPTELGAVQFVNTEESSADSFEYVTDQIELKEKDPKKRRNKSRTNRNKSGNPPKSRDRQPGSQKKETDPKQKHFAPKPDDKVPPDQKTSQDHEAKNETDRRRRSNSRRRKPRRPPPKKEE